MATKTSVQPLFNNVLVRPLQGDTTTPSGIVLPDTAKEKPQVGEVMAIGPGDRTPEGKILPMTVKVGQKVLYKKWGGDEVKAGNEEWLIVKETDITAIVE